MQNSPARSPLGRFRRWLWHRDWFSPKLGKSIYKRLAAEGDPPSHPFTANFFGLRYEGNLRNNIDFNIFYYGAFEKPLLYFLRDCAHMPHIDKMVFCDVGSNVGQHSLFMSGHSHQVHAFEPFEPVRLRLEHQVQLNGLGNIRVHPVGLGEANEQLTFYSPVGQNQGVGSFAAEAEQRGNVPVGELSIVAADDYFKSAGIDRVDLIKIDVEGFERPALAGMNQILAAQRPLLVIEITYGESLSFTSLDDLQRALPSDYRLFTFDKRKPGGRTARRRGAIEKRTGAYRLVPFTFEFPFGQDDIIACPDERIADLPMRSSTKH